jgi:hypothetical protein
MVSLIDPPPPVKSDTTSKVTIIYIGILEKAKPDAVIVIGLKLAAVKHMTVQVIGCRYSVRYLK